MSAIDDAEQVLETVAERPLGEHVGAYDEVHRLLQDALAALDES